MANLTDAWERKLLDGLVGVTPLTTQTTVYMALFTADPTDTGSVASELSGDGYVRLSMSGLFSSATGTDGATPNTALIEFPSATAIWTTVTHFALMESSTVTADDMMMWFELDSPVTIAIGQTFKFNIGNFIVNAG